MWKQRAIRLGMGVLLALSLIGWDTPAQSNPVQAQGTATFDCTIVTEIPQSECEALVAFYTSADGDNWRNKTGWLQTNTPCTWYGLACDAGHVSHLKSNANNLHGHLSEELGALTELVELWLVDADLPGPMPASLTNLQRLQTLILVNVGLTGSLPLDIGKLTAIRVLYLRYNQLTGSIPPQLGNLTYLEHLYLNFTTGHF